MKAAWTPNTCSTACKGIRSDRIGQARRVRKLCAVSRMRAQQLHSISFGRGRREAQLRWRIRWRHEHRCMLQLVITRCCARRLPTATRRQQVQRRAQVQPLHKVPLAQLTMRHPRPSARCRALAATLAARLPRAPSLLPAVATTTAAQRLLHHPQPKPHHPQTTLHRLTRCCSPAADRQLDAMRGSDACHA